MMITAKTIKFSEREQSWQPLDLLIFIWKRVPRSARVGGNKRLEDK